MSKSDKIKQVIPRVDPYEDLSVITQNNSCCVVALACATGWTYRHCLELCRMHGREDDKAMFHSQVEAMFKSLPWKAKVTGPYSSSKRITIANFVKKHPEGNFFCAHRGHAFAIKDGVLYDHKDGPLRQIKYAVRIYPEHLS